MNEVAPTEDTAMIKRVRQSRMHKVWRISHPYREGIALRLIVWFPPVDGSGFVRGQIRLSNAGLKMRRKSNEQERLRARK